MSAAAPPRTSRWKRRIGRILAALLLAPVVFLLLANLLLATPWIRGWLERKISVRTGAETTLGSVSVTPWGGMSIGGLTLLQPPALRATHREPMLEIREVRVVPQWEKLLRGKIGIDRIRIDRPRAVVSLEMLAGMVSAGVAEPGRPPSAPAAVAGAPAVESPVPGGAPGAASPLAPPAEPKAVGPPAVPGTTTWIELEDGDLEIRLAGGKVLAVAGFSGRIPAGGAMASSSLRVREVISMDRILASGLSLPLFWTGTELRTRSVEIPFAGMLWNASAAIAPLPGIPFAAEVLLPVQAADGSAYCRTLRPSARRLEARLQGIGLLRHPSTWQGLAQAAAEGVGMTVAAQEMKFDDGRAVLVLQGGVLQCPDARLTGDRLSLLGNGRLPAGGQGTAVLRAVVPPDLAEFWTARLAAAGQRPVFSPMDTPDRRFIDLRWIPYSGGHGIELGTGGPVIPAGEIGPLFAPVAAN